LRHIAENSSEEIGGVKTIEALGAMNLTSGGRANIAAVDSLNLTTARDLRCIVADNKREGIGKDQQTEVKGSRTSSIQGADSNTVGQNFTQTIAGASTETIGGNATQQISGNATQSVEGTINVNSGAATIHTAGGVFTISAPKVKIGSASGGSGGVSLLDEMLTVWQEVRDALEVLAGHTHSVSGAGTGAPNQSGVIAGHGDEVEACGVRVDGINYSVVLAHGPDVGKLALAFQIALEKAVAGNKHLTIFAPTIKDFSTTIVSEVLGLKNAQKLAKNKILHYSEGTIGLVSKKTINPLGETGVILGLWCSEDMMESLDKCIRATDRVAISWSPEQMRSWAEQRGAVIF